MVTFHLLIKTLMYLYEPQMIFTESQKFLLHLHVENSVLIVKNSSGIKRQKIAYRNELQLWSLNSSIQKVISMAALKLQQLCTNIRVFFVILI